MVEQLKRELDEDHGASNRRIRAAQERAARERVERIVAAQQARAEIAKQREQREKKGHGKETESKKQPRASTTDPQARVMKMANGGFRSAYNVQVASVSGEQIVVAIDPCTTGSDRGLMRPMLNQVHASTGQLPERHLADGGFGSGKDIEWG